MLHDDRFAIRRITGEIILTFLAVYTLYLIITKYGIV